MFTCFTVEWLLLIDPCFNVGDGELEVLVVIEPRAPITRCLMLAVMGGRWDSMAPLLQERTTKAQVLASLLRHKLGRMLLGDTDIIPRLRLDHLLMLNLTSTLLSGRLELARWVGCSYILTSLGPLILITSAPPARVNAWRGQYLYRQAGNHFELVDFLKLCLLDIAQKSPT